MNNEEYTIGWICALHCEYVAAQLFLDEEHAGPQSIAPHDNNDYTLGRIGRHNIVIAVLPDGEYGATSAACVARDMLHCFPNVRVGLLVGIAGGAPSTLNDIRLGDVVVSSPKNGIGGVCQFDLAATIRNHELKVTGHLDQPPTALRAAVTGVRSRYEANDHQIHRRIEEKLTLKPRLRKRFDRPDRDSDILHQSDGLQPWSRDGSYPDEKAERFFAPAQRTQRDSSVEEPVIHYGLIASGQILTDARLRDTLAHKEGILCFETQAAGLMNHFPCLVIRGICDYSDSHKETTWHGYAAATAAAYAVDVIRRLLPARIKSEKRISDVLSSGESLRLHWDTKFFGKDLTPISLVEKTVRKIESKVEELTVNSGQNKFREWLSASNPSSNYESALQQRLKGTGRWLLKHKDFKRWKSENNSFLRLRGIPGSGKTVLSAAVIRHLEKIGHAQTTLYFYFDFSDTSKQELGDMIRSLVNQLYWKYEETPKPLKELYTACDEGRSQPRLTSLRKAFFETIKVIPDVFVVIDALDECCTTSKLPKDGLLGWISSCLSSKETNLHFLVTSRPVPELDKGLRNLESSGSIVDISHALIGKDIYRYIQTRVRSSEKLKRWHGHPDMYMTIEADLMLKADGM